LKFPGCIKLDVGAQQGWEALSIIQVRAQVLVRRTWTCASIQTDFSNL